MSTIRQHSLVRTMTSPATLLTDQISFTRRTRSSATSAEIQHVSLTSYSRPNKRTRKDCGKVEGAATGNVTALALPKPEGSAPLGAVPKKRRRAKGDYADLGSDPLTDRIREELDVLFCGENPGIRTAETQLHCKVALEAGAYTKALTPRLPREQMRRLTITSIKRCTPRDSRRLSSSRVRAGRSLKITTSGSRT